MLDQTDDEAAEEGTRNGSEAAENHAGIHDDDEFVSRIGLERIECRRGRTGNCGECYAKAESDAMSKDLKKRGFKFVGSTICYAYMQATGMVNDHVKDCFRYRELK